MIVGKGLIANQFIDYDKKDIVFFASGVSNSSEIRKEEFEREQKLVIKTLNEYPNCLFIYFSTCSIYDSSKYNSPYVLHKLHIEEVIKSLSKKYLILRVSNAVGKGGNPNLLLNYLNHQIVNNKDLIIHKYATRNLIDVRDVRDITLKYISNGAINKIVNVAYLYNFEILEIVKAFEEITNKVTNKLVEDKGEHYSIDIHELDFEFKTLDKNQYLMNMLHQYFIDYNVSQKS